MKKILLLAVVALSMSLVACGGGDKSKEAKDGEAAEAPKTEVADTVKITKAETPEAAAKNYMDAYVSGSAEGMVATMKYEGDEAQKRLEMARNGLKMAKEANLKVLSYEIGKGEVVEKDKKVKFNVMAKIKDMPEDAPFPLTVVNMGEEKGWKLEDD